MHRPLALLVALIVLIVLVMLAVPAVGQSSSGAQTPASGGIAPPIPGADGPPGGRPAGPPGMGGVPKGSHVKLAADPVKAAPKIGLIAGIIAVIAIGVVLVMKKRK